HSVYDASYLSILRDLGCDIVGVSDRSARIATDRAQRFGSKPFADYREMVETTKPEFVIALGRHCDMPDIFRFLVGAGVPFVMEKPWGTDADTVASLARLAAEKSAWVAVPFMARYSFWAVTVKRIIEAGEFGNVSHIFYRGIRPTMRRYVEWDSPWMADKSLAGGGALLNLGGHGFDMARFVTGEEPQVVSAVVSRQVHGGEVEDYALATLRTPSGILFHNEVGYTMPSWPANQTDGEQKVAGEKLLLRQVPGGLRLIGPGRDEFIPQPEGWQAGYPRAIHEALEACGRGDPPPIPASECARAVRLIFDSYRAAAHAV
ncbi:MAG: Gfo/Idh/MocA family oxidoreductase, partial [Alphaproteobacteria bacterium]|nr:Gfo/Idh/MocA family oxidoreductase [Alphaproteobacteria bacterium]